MVEKWREALDKVGLGGALPTDISTAFDCIKHDFLIAKLATYGFDLHYVLFSVTLMRENKEQKYKVPTTPTLI